MERRMKEKAVGELHQKMKDASIAIIAEFSGIDVATVTDIRARCRENRVDYKVVKNTLAKIAAKDTPVEVIEDQFTGPVVLMLGEDPVTPAKLMAAFAKENEGKLKVRVGVTDGQVLDASGLETLAKMPSLDELRGTLVGLLGAPATKLVRLVGTPGQDLARVVDARREALSQAS